MNLFTRLHLWSANRHLQSLSLEIAAARDYEENTIMAYENEERSRSDLAEEILEVRHKIEYLEDEHILTIAYIVELEAEQVFAT